MKKYQNKRNSTASKVWTALGLLGLAVAFIFALKVGAERQAVVDCYEWQSWVKEGYVLFTPDKAMIDDCRSVGVELK